MNRMGRVYLAPESREIRKSQQNGLCVNIRKDSGNSADAGNNFWKFQGNFLSLLLQSINF